MRTRKRFAQHFLEPVWVRKVVERIGPAASDRFVEIGPGRGAITEGLAAAAERVVAIELDLDLAADLRARAGSNVTVVEGDVLRVDLAAVARDLAGTAAPPAIVRIAGNLPYNISSPILFRLIEVASAVPSVRDATLMLQQEVADRILGRPGTKAWGPLAIFVQLAAEVEALLALPPGAFRPAPRVRSALVKLVFRPSPVSLDDPRAFRALVRGLFMHRRKTLANALRSVVAGRAEEAATALARAGLDGRRRPETLDLAELAHLARHLPSGQVLPVL